jgi:hypothetical protein
VRRLPRSHRLNGAADLCLRRDCDSMGESRRRYSGTSFHSIEVGPRMLVIRLDVECFPVHLCSEVATAGLLVRDPQIKVR